MELSCEAIIIKLDAFIDLVIYSSSRTDMMIK